MLFLELISLRFAADNIIFFDFQIDEDICADNTPILLLSQISKARIISKNIPDIVTTRKVEKYQEKADVFSSLSSNERSFRKMYTVSSFAKKFMTEAYGQEFLGPCIRVRKDHPVICGVVSGMIQ